MTAASKTNLGLKGRGLISLGLAADLVIFNPDIIQI